ncbi:MAG TPA: prenyltransferase/squalene oxidase repeat-containing protein [Gemmataceae bacterium]|nr:prenyltransferase/squalene oxidase repeat-containing protein [Gemmataceae bacterium]
MRRALLLALLVVPAPAVGQTADEKAASVKFLASLQQPDGGFVAGPDKASAAAVPQSSLRATSAAVRAIKYLGGEVPNKDKAATFVKACYTGDAGAFADRPKGKPDVNLTAIGIMAAAELIPDFDFGPPVKYLAANAKTFEERRLAAGGMEAARTIDPVVKDWLAETEKGRNPDGTYGIGDGQARETGSVTAMIYRTGGKLSDEHRKPVVAALRAGQRLDGGYGKADAKASDMETTYRVMRAFHWLKEKPNDEPKLREFIARHRNADGGYGTAPGQPSTAGGTYYAAIVGYWLEK